MQTSDVALLQRGKITARPACFFMVELSGLVEDEVEEQVPMHAQLLANFQQSYL